LSFDALRAVAQKMHKLSPSWVLFTPCSSCTFTSRFSVSLGIEVVSEKIAKTTNIKQNILLIKFILTDVRLTPTNM
jgi:hypothetical protein